MCIFSSGKTYFANQAGFSTKTQARRVSDVWAGICVIHVYYSGTNFRSHAFRDFNFWSKCDILQENVRQEEHPQSGRHLPPCLIAFAIAVMQIWKLRSRKTARQRNGRGRCPPRVVAILARDPRISSARAPSRQKDGLAHRGI